MARSQAWKEKERRVAKAFGLERNLMKGKSVPDTTEHPHFCIEVKYRKTVAKQVTDALNQAKDYEPEKIPLAVLFEHHTRDGFAVMKFKDFMEMYRSSKYYAGEKVDS